MEKMRGATLDFIETNKGKLRELFPECFVDGEVDLEKIALLLGSAKESNEKYSFNWIGKNDAVKFSLTPSAGTLIPEIDKSLDWENTQNIYIEGDNLEVLKLLQKTYSKKIKMIYIDPPYNTGGDFVYKDNFSNSLENYKEITKQTGRTNPETSGRFHTDWLNMIYPRLCLAKNLLTEDGIICISIDDHEITNLKKVCDELFGDDNCLGLLPRITKKSGKAHSLGFAKNHDYVLVYCNSIYECELNGVDSDSDGFDLADEYVASRGKYKLNQTLDYDSLWYNPNMDFEINVNGEKFVPGGSIDAHRDRHQGIHNPKDWVWRWSKAKFDFGLQNGFVVIKRGKDRARIYTKTYLKAKIAKDSTGKYYVETIERENNVSSINFVDNKYSNDNAKKELSQIIDPSMFDFPKPVTLIEDLIRVCDTEDMIVLDFFSGSATTGQAVMEANKDGNKRKFILVQLPELLNDDSKAKKELKLNNLCDLAEYRLKAYISKAKKADTNLLDSQNIDLGFKVFRLDSTNIKPWDPSVKYDENSILDLLDVVKEGRTSLDIAYEVMLKYGVFNMPLEEIEVNGKKVYSVGCNYMIISLNDSITSDDVLAIAKLGPKAVVFKEKGFKDDNEKINADYTFKRLGIDNVKCI